MERRQIIQSDGVEISWSVQGKGPPVLLIHGFTMWSDMWNANGVVAATSTGYRLILPDLRGHGRSSKPHDPARYGRALVRDLVSILDSEGVKTAHVAGFSLGAQVALKLAVSHPERVLSLLLIGSGWSGAEVMPHYRAFAGQVRASGQQMTPEPDYDAFDALVEGMPEVIGVSRNEVESLRIPAAGIAGSEDPELPDLECLAGVLEGFSLEVLPGVPHETSWRDPSIPAKVTNFLGSASK